jgi:hypothetical protein
VRLPPVHSRLRIDRYGKISGGDIATGSIPSRAVPRNGTLGDINPELGTVYTGTIYCGEDSGNPGAARLILGDGADGLVIEDSNGRPFVAFQWSGNIRAGMPGKLGWWLDSDGNVQIDGDCNVQGSITANRLAIGDFAKVILESDRIQVGEDMGQGWCGFLAQSSGIGGWLNGQQTWYVETSTGKIVSTDPNVTEGEYVRTQLGAGYLDVYSLFGYTDSGIRFRAYRDDEIEGYVYDEVMLRLRNMGSSTSGMVMFWNKNSMEAPSIQLANQVAQPLSMWSPSGISFGAGEQDYTSFGLYSLMHGGSSFNISARAYDPGTGTYLGLGTLAVEGNALALRHMTLYPAENGGYGYAPQPIDPHNGELWWDSINNQWQCYNGTAWYTIDMTAVP